MRKPEISNQICFGDSLVIFKHRESLETRRVDLLHIFVISL